MENPFSKIKSELVAAIEELPLIIGNVAVNHFKDKFVEGTPDGQQWDGVPWPEVQRRKQNEQGEYEFKSHWSKGYKTNKDGSVKRAHTAHFNEAGEHVSSSISTHKVVKDYTKADRTRAILNKTGRLMRSIKIIRYDLRGVEVGLADLSSGISYGEVHNFGLKAGRGKGFTMPKRQFIGIEKALELKIDLEVYNALKAATDSL